MVTVGTRRRSSTRRSPRGDVSGSRGRHGGEAEPRPFAGRVVEDPPGRRRRRESPLGRGHSGRRRPGSGRGASRANRHPTTPRGRDVLDRGSTSNTRRPGCTRPHARPRPRSRAAVQGQDHQRAATPPRFVIGQAVARRTRRSRAFRFRGVIGSWLRRRQRSTPPPKPRRPPPTGASPAPRRSRTGHPALVAFAIAAGDAAGGGPWGRAPARPSGAGPPLPSPARRAGRGAAPPARRP